METNQNNYQEQEFIQLTRLKVKKLKSFYIHLLIYLVGISVYILKEYFGVPLNFSPLNYINCFVMTIWSIVFFITAIDIVITFHFFGKNWEDRKIKSIMEKKTEKQIWK
jgi:hypothetical protein